MSAIKPQHKKDEIILLKFKLFWKYFVFLLIMKDRLSKKSLAIMFSPKERNIFLLQNLLNA